MTESSRAPKPTNGQASATARRPWPRDDRYLIGADGTITGPSGRVLRANPSRAGYLRLCMGSGRRVMVHQVVCETFHGPRPPGLVVAHNNGDCKDNRASNLRWDTRSENQRDIARHGRTPRGERHSHNKLNDEAVRDIRSSPLTQKALAKRYGVHPTTISYVRRGLTWGHVK